MTEHHDTDGDIDGDIDVLVVGAGPVGSTLAADLLRRGLRVRLIDKAPHAFEGSRAKGVQPRTQEVFGDLGVLREAHAEGGAYPLMGIHIGPITVPWRMQSPHRPCRTRTSCCCRSPAPTPSCTGCSTGSVCASSSASRWTASNRTTTV